MGRISTSEAAKKHGIARSTVSRWVNKGKLSYTTEYHGTRAVRMIDEDEILALCTCPESTVHEMGESDEAPEDASEDEPIAVSAESRIADTRLVEMLQHLALKDRDLTLKDAEVSRLREANDRLMDRLVSLAGINGNLDSTVTQLTARLDDRDREIARLQDEIGRQREDHARALDRLQGLIRDWQKTAVSRFGPSNKNLG